MILVLKLSLQRIFLGYVVLTYLYNYVQFSKNIYQLLTLITLSISSLRILMYI